MIKPKEKAIEIKTTEELSVTDYTKVAGKKWVSYEDYKEQQKENKAIRTILSLVTDTCEQQVNELMEQQKEIDDLKAKNHELMKGLGYPKELKRTK